ncbi:MAG: ABC transporter permease [bacterium]|nr:ABC transporter permease [bacterium]
MNGSVILAMVALRLRRIFRDRSALIWFFVMPMVFSFLMGQLLGDWGGSGQPSRPRFLVYADEPGPELERFLAPLRDHERFVVEVRDTTVSAAALAEAVEDSRITAGLLVPSGFEAAAAGDDTASLRLYFDSDRLSSQTIRTLLEEALLRANTAAAARSLVADPAGGEPGRGAAQGFDQVVFDRLWEEPRVRLAVETLGRKQEEPEFALTNSYQHVGPSYTLFFVMMGVLALAQDLVAERRQRTLARLVTSRAGPADLVLGFLAGGFVMGLVQSVILLVLNSLLFRIDYGDSPLTLGLAMMLFAGVCAGASVLLGTVARTEAQASGLGVATTLVLAAMGGLWWPLEIVPPFMQTLGKLLPTGQAITVFHDLIGRGWGLAENLPLLVGLAVWCVVLTVMATWRLRRVMAS